jgi:hypothetical protein
VSSKKIAKAVATRNRAIARAHEEFRRTVLRVHETGMPVSRIAEAAGLSRQRIYQLLDREGRNDQGRKGRMRIGRRTLTLGVLAVTVAVAVPVAVLSSSHRSASRRAAVAELP